MRTVEFNEDFEFKDLPDEATPDEAKNANIAIYNTWYLKKNIDDIFSRLDVIDSILDVINELKLLDFTLEQGSVAGGTGEDMISNARVRTTYITVEPSTEYQVSIASADYFCIVFPYNENFAFDKNTEIDTGNWNDTFPYNFTTGAETRYIRVTTRKREDTNFTPSELPPMRISKVKK